MDVVIHDKNTVTFETQKGVAKVDFTPLITKLSDVAKDALLEDLEMGGIDGVINSYVEELVFEIENKDASGNNRQTVFDVEVSGKFTKNGIPHWLSAELV